MRERAQQFSFAVVTMSDKGSRGEREDTSGKLLQALLQEEGYTLKAYVVVPDDRAVIIETLLALTDNRKIDLIVTTGGTGVAAIVVGRITVTGIDADDVPLGVQRIEPGIAVERGGEIGMFHLGSTAVVFLEPKAMGRWLASWSRISPARSALPSSAQTFSNGSPREPTA